MTIEIITIPCLSDNYAFLLHDQDTGTTALIDAPEAYPIQRVLDDKGWNLDFILLPRSAWRVNCLSGTCCF